MPFSPSQIQQLEQLSAQWITHLETSWGLRSQIATRVGIAYAIMQFFGISPPKIISGYRSPSRQLQLIAQWESGQRSGFSSRPSVKSWHMQGYAIDVHRSAPSFSLLKDLLLIFGLRYGGNFRSPSPNHFDLPTGTQYTAQQLIAMGKDG